MAKLIMNKKNRIKPFSSMCVLVVLSMLSLSHSALANDGLKLNIFPTIGKPIYGVAEFDSSVSDPVSVTVASEEEYRKAGYVRPDFLDNHDVRKLSVKRYLIKSADVVDRNDFELLLDVTFEDKRRIYPVNLVISMGSVSANFAAVTDYALASKKTALDLNRPAVATVAPIQEPSITVSQESIKLPKLITQSEPKIQVTSAELPAEAVLQQLQQSHPYSTLAAPLQQTPVFYSPGLGNSQSVSNNSEQFPFYLVIIVLTVLILVAMFVVVLFMHKNHDARHHPVQHDQHSLMSDLLKTLPSLIGHNNNNHHQQPALAAHTQGMNNQWLQSQQQQYLIEQQQQELQQQQLQRKKKQKRKSVPKRTEMPVEAQHSEQVNEPQQPLNEPISRPMRAPVANSSEVKQAPKPNVAPSNAAIPPKPVPAKPVAAARQQTMPGQAKKPMQSSEKSEKLQLAIVYMNMGDDVMARMLLDEISRDGSDAEKAEAKAILEKMNTPNDRPIIAENSDNKE